PVVRLVTCLITTSHGRTGAVVTIAGQLNKDAVPELERVVGALPGPLHLDLTGLRSADEAGLDALRVLRERGVRLTGVSPVHPLLRGDARAPGRGTARRKGKQTPASGRTLSENPRGRRRR